MAREWVRVCDLGELAEGSVTGAECAGRRIVLARSGERVYAADAVCTHQDADLSAGLAAECDSGAPGVRCPLHLSVFDLGSGAALNPPAEAPLRTYDTRVDANAVYVGV